MSRCRAARTAKGTAAAPISSGATEALGEFASRTKATWARLIRRVYESDPLECPKCKGLMRVIALIDDPVVVRTILAHLGRWQPKAVEHAPPCPRVPGPRMRARRSRIILYPDIA